MKQNIKRRQFIELMGTGLAAGVLAGWGCSGSKAQSKSPNFILIYTDDMGYGDLGSFGHPTIKTPNLDRMADEGIRLTSFCAGASICTPSRVSLLTGRYPVRTGVVNNFFPQSKGGLPLDEILLPQVLKTRGYKTMAIGKWHLGHDPVDYMPTSRGFDSYFGLRYSNDMLPPWVETDIPLTLYRDTEPTEHPLDQTTLTEKYTEEALKFIRTSKDSPFFLYLPHSMPHVPVSASEKFEGTSRAGIYGDVIEALDWSVGRILETLKELGLDEQTMVIFTSDNGPWMNMPDRMMRGGVELSHAGTAGLLRGSKGSTYEGGFRVPFIARWPKHIPAGQVSADMACTMDLYTTLIEAAGAKVPQDRVVDGQNIMSLLTGKDSSPREVFFYFRGNQLRAVRKGKWKFRLNYRTRTVREPDELFDLDADPGENYNVLDQHRDIADEMLGMVNEMSAEFGAEARSINW